MSVEWENMAQFEIRLQRLQYVEWCRLMRFVLATQAKYIIQFQTDESNNANNKSFIYFVFDDDDDEDIVLVVIAVALLNGV